MSSGPRRLLAPAALALACVSLALNLYLLAQLQSPERWALPAVERALGPLLGDDGVVTYTVSIPAGTPLSLDIPVSERFSIAVDTVIPINTTVRVPFDTPVGRRAVTLPIRARHPRPHPAPARRPPYLPTPHPDHQRDPRPGPDPALGSA